jgi:hypothetical protein
VKCDDNYGEKERKEKKNMMMKSKTVIMMSVFRGEIKL